MLARFSALTLIALFLFKQNCVYVYKALMNLFYIDHILQEYYLLLHLSITSEKTSHF